MPCIIYAINNNWCPPTMNLKLSWDGSTSDVDLHVYEQGGSGEHVYFDNMQGDYGFLDLDDVNGFGPEHYIVDDLNEPQVFKTEVHMYSYHADSVVNWQLEAEKDGQNVWTETGTFDASSSERWSDEFSIVATPSTCGQCFSSSPGGRRLSGNWCPPKQYTSSFWCFWCKREVRPAYKFWESMSGVNDPTVAQVKGLARMVFADGIGLPSHSRVFYELGMSNIQDRNNCLPAVWDTLLSIFCANDALQESLGGILEGNNMISLINLLGSASNGTPWYELVLDWYQSDLEGGLMEGAANNLKSFTAERGLVSEFMSATNLCLNAY